MVRPRRDIRVTSVPGWCGKSFVLPDESYRPSGPDRKKLLLARQQTVLVGEYRRKGTLDEWKRHNGRKIVHSTRARLAVAVNFAAPNLRPLGLNSFGFNFSGTTSGGKTLLLRMAASASGLNSNAGPATWDGTPAAFEQRAMGHRDGMMLLDDIGHLEGDQKCIAKLVTFRLAGNRAKERAGQYVVAHNLVEEDLPVIALSTSEDPLWGHLNENGPRRVRGQEVRMIDVPACVSEMQDVFDGDSRSKVGKTVEQRRRFVEKQERLARQYQGEALRAYLAKRVSDKAARANLKKLMKEFIDNAPLPDQQRWLGRIQRLFAVVYASAAQAIDYGVLPWGKKSTLSAIRVCMVDAMQQLIANSGGDAESDRGDVQSDERMLAEFKRRLDDAKFVRLERNRRKKKISAVQLKMADGIIRRTKPGKCEYLLFARTMQAWYSDFTILKRITKLLRSRKIFRDGRRADTSTRQVLISELGKKIACYGLVRKRLKTAPAEAKCRK